MTLNDFDPVACRYDYLVTDSRSVFNPSKTIFAAIRTDLGDGHNYISDLYRKGVRAFIVDNLLENAPADATFIVTPNVPKYLSDIARTRTSSLSKGIIVTGSVGKTTMKELLYQSLIGECDVRRSPRSWNSSIGVPLAIWDMTRKPGDNPSWHRRPRTGAIFIGNTGRIAFNCSHHPHNRRARRGVQMSCRQDQRKD